MLVFSIHQMVYSVIAKHVQNIVRWPMQFNSKKSPTDWWLPSAYSLQTEPK